MPAAELEITADLVSRLLAAQHPDLAGLTVEPLANGWDNTLFLLGEELVARLPRRTLGASILLNEQRWLPSLAPRLPLPVPVPVRTGGPGEGYPWPWSVVALLPGTPASDGPPLDPRRAAADLGGFFGRGWALNLALVFLAWSADNPRLHAVGQHTLAAALAR
jgi:aminoglycoside phosphotransferase (APT) family kinase protein